VVHGAGVWASWLLFSHWFSSFELFAVLRETLMIGTSKILAVITCCFALLVGATAQAGYLAGNPFAYNDGLGPLAGAWTGSAPFVNDGLQGSVDWAVFTATTFNTLFGDGAYVAPAGELVYAHQINTLNPPLGDPNPLVLLGATGMQITLAGNPAGNGGSFSSAGPTGLPIDDVTGVPAFITAVSPVLATFGLIDETDITNPSEGLVYSSPNRPQLTGVPIIADGGVSAATSIPIGIPSSIPIPEPTTGLIASMVTGLLFAFRRVRRG
jgi:hypothetical protein